jgi:hemerythrin-like domain-containing protein
MAVSCQIDALQADHRKFHALLDQLEAHLGGLRRGTSADYTQAIQVLDQLTQGCNTFRDHSRRENALFRKLDRQAGRPLLVHDALERQRQRVSSYRIALEQKLCAMVSGADNLYRGGLEEAIRTYSTGLRAQIAFEEYVMYPLASVFLDNGVAD